MKINELSNSGLGIEITDIDLTKPLNEKDVNIIRNLWLNYSVAVFPNQKLNHFEFEKFSLNFGAYGDDPYLIPVDSNHPHIMEIRRDANEKTALFGGTWHSDWSFQKKPPSATLLHSKIIPPIEGDTLFCNNIKSYNDLPIKTKKELSNPLAFHSAKEIYGDDGFYANENKDEGRSIKIKNPKNAIKKGIVMIPEDRRKLGLVFSQNTKSNISITNTEKISKFSILNTNKEIELVKKLIDEIDIKPNTPEGNISYYSGGNQQKVLFAKWIFNSPKLILLDEPTRGVDIGAKRKIYELINKLAESGVGVLLVSSELEEVMGLADRAYLIKNGRTYEEIVPKNTLLDDVLFSLFDAKKNNEVKNEY